MQWFPVNLCQPTQTDTNRKHNLFLFSILGRWCCGRYSAQQEPSPTSCFNDPIVTKISPIISQSIKWPTYQTRAKQWMYPLEVLETHSWTLTHFPHFCLSIQDSNFGLFLSPNVSNKSPFPRWWSHQVRQKPFPRANWIIFDSWRWLISTRMSDGKGLEVTTWIVTAWVNVVVLGSFLSSLSRAVPEKKVSSRAGYGATE